MAAKQDGLVAEAGLAHLRRIETKSSRPMPIHELPFRTRMEDHEKSVIALSLFRKRNAAR